MNVTTSAANEWALAAFFLMGVASLPHCAGMCGGIALSLARRPEPIWISHLGRLIVYMALGLASGTLTLSLTVLVPVLGGPMRTLAALMMALSALQMLGVRVVPLAWVEQTGRRLASGSLQRLSPLGGIGWGMAWGLLPCGAVYTAVAASAGLVHPLLSAMAMLAFGIGTLPALTGAGWIARQMSVKPVLRITLAMLILVLAFASTPLAGLIARAIDPDQQSTFLHQHNHEH